MKKILENSPITSAQRDYEASLPTEPEPLPTEPEPLPTEPAAGRRLAAGRLATACPALASVVTGILTQVELNRAVQKPDTCPCCGSTELEGDSCDYQDEMIGQDVYCTDCSREWRLVYQVVQAVNV